MLELDLEGIDVSGWERVGGTAAGGYFRASPDVLVAVPRLEYRQTVEEARESLREFERVARESGRAQAVIVMVDRVTEQDSGSRRVWSEEASPEHGTSIALVCSSRLSRAIGSFFIGLNRPSMPTRMFATFDEALEWSKRQVRERDR